MHARRPKQDGRFFQIAEHCNREQFNALIGTSYCGIVVSDRWNGYSHLDPNQRQVCWSHLLKVWPALWTFTTIWRQADK